MFGKPFEVKLTRDTRDRARLKANPGANRAVLAKPRPPPALHPPNIFDNLRSVLLQQLGEEGFKYHHQQHPAFVLTTPGRVTIRGVAGVEDCDEEDVAWIDVYRQKVEFPALALAARNEKGAALREGLLDLTRGGYGIAFVLADKANPVLAVAPVQQDGVVVAAIRSYLTYAQLFEQRVEHAVRARPGVGAFHNEYELRDRMPKLRAAGVNVSDKTPDILFDDHLFIDSARLRLKWLDAKSSTLADVMLRLGEYEDKARKYDGAFAGVGAFVLNDDDVDVGPLQPKQIGSKLVWVMGVRYLESRCV